MKLLKIAWDWVFPEPRQKVLSSKFVDLAPTSDADEFGIYSEALDYATSNPEVLNIAVTGPYGSGKSSVIKSFLTRYPRRVLQLSLASFLPDGELPRIKVSKQEIERSILQQILYGADAGELPFSRFRRIQTPKRWSPLTSLFVSLGILSVGYVFSKMPDVVGGDFFKPLELSNWPNLLAFAVAAAFVWTVVHAIHVRSLGLSLKSISLKDVEIAPAATDSESILNRHLDEIVYFFQCTEYDLVVIEDLDRFDNPDIFVTLREINALINASAGVRRHVRFLYALRDEIFLNTDRTKFFEFVVPVIPVISHSNSIDKVLEQAKRVSLDGRLDSRFLRDVSRFLNDLRLIRNVFNEYQIYSASLETEKAGGLDPNKLLAILIYKNVLPSDFAALHRQGGVLSNVLARYDDYISRSEEMLRSKLLTIEAQLATAESQQHLRDTLELRKVYAMAILERIPVNFPNLRIGNKQAPFSRLLESGQLEDVLSKGTVTVYSPSSGGTQTIDMSDLESSVDPTRSFLDRKSMIDYKSADQRRVLLEEARQIRMQIASLRTKKFNEVVRENAALIEEVFSDVRDGRDLLRFLILEGYLDDTYYQYTSLFYGGRLSPNDNRFLIQIRSYNNPPPDFQLDNVGEVISSMRQEDFGHTYVLNRLIFDHLLADPTERYSTGIRAAVEFISTHFDHSEDFFLSYYERGAHVDLLVERLSTYWPEFTDVAVGTRRSAMHAARIIAYAPASHLSEFREVLAEHFSLNAQAVLDERVELGLHRLRDLDVQVADLPSIANYPDVVAFLVAEGLYSISISNIRHVMGHVVGWPNLADLETRHFTTVLRASDERLISHLDADFETYVREVLLALEGNTSEDAPVVLKVLRRDDVDQDLLSDFLRKQSTILSSLEGVPSAFHTLMLKEAKIEATWVNCMLYLTSDSYDSDVFTSYLQAGGTKAELSKHTVPDGEASAQLRRFLLENDDLDAQTYRAYVRRLPGRVSAFPDVDSSKLKALIEEHKVDFSVQSFGQLEDEELRVLFVSLNFDAYSSDKDTYRMDDSSREMLLRSGIKDSQKLSIISDMDPAFVSRAPHVAIAIGEIVDRSESAENEFGSELVKAILLNSQSTVVQISLLNKLHGSLSDSEVRDFLRGLPEPFCEIGGFGKSPRIEDTADNGELVSWLSERKLISSFSKPILGGIRINTFRRES